MKDININFDMDDKQMVIVALLIIAVCSMFTQYQNAFQIVSNVVTGLSGIAVGKAWGESKK